MREGIIIAIAAVVALVAGGIMFAVVGKKPSTLTLKPNVHIAGGKDGFTVRDVAEDSVTIDEDSSIEEGAILAGGTGQAAPNGFLRKVTSVKKRVVKWCSRPSRPRAMGKSSRIRVTNLTPPDPWSCRST